MQEEIKGQFKDKELPPEVAEGLAAMIVNKNNGFIQVQERQVTVENDSSFITLNYSSNKQAMLQINTRRFLVYSGTLFRLNEQELYVESDIPEISRRYTPTNNYIQVLGYKCHEFISSDDRYKIWVTEELPTTINPGISALNIRGSILRFEVINNNARTTSTASTISKVE